MPIPSPKGKEKQKDFISRCMGNKTMTSEYSDNKQRAAVCYSAWRKAKKSKGEEITREDYDPFELEEGKFEAEKAADIIVKALKSKK